MKIYIRRLVLTNSVIPNVFWQVVTHQPQQSVVFSIIPALSRVPCIMEVLSPSKNSDQKTVIAKYAGQIAQLFFT